MLPPPWGREGVILLAAAENKRITQKKRISTKPQFLQNWLMSGLFVPHGPQKHRHSPNDTILFMGT